MTRLRTYGSSTLGVYPTPVVAAIRDRQPFTTGGALRATTDAWDRSPGRLEGAALERWRCELSSVDYVVWSYGTPIAWHVQRPWGCYWSVPDDRYSVTTTRHQGMVAQAVRLARLDSC